MDDGFAISTMAAERNNITQVVKQTSRRLLSFIRKQVANLQDAEDLLQDVFYQLAVTAQPIEATSAWLYTVAKNKITDSYRKKKLPLAESIFDEEENDDGILWKDILFADDATVETEYLRTVFWQELDKALFELPFEQRDVFIKNELEGIAFKEIAAQTGDAVATLISRKRYAVLHLRKRLSIIKNELLNN